VPTSGYPTPDNFAGDADFICIPLVVPNKTEFVAAIYGQYAEMTREYYWKQFGTMSPETAAFLASRGLALTDAYSECGGVMTCEEIADCIENDIDAQTAIADAINSNVDIQTSIINQIGGLGDPNQIVGNKTMFKDRNPVGSLENDAIKDLLNCDLNLLWGGLRYGIVERADDDVRSMLESLAAISSIPDRLIEFLEAIPILGDIAQATLDLITEAVPTLLTLFDSYSSLDHMDEYACGLFSIVCADCRYPTVQELYNYNKSFGITSMPEMAAAVFQAIVDAVVGSTESASQIAYFTLMNFRLGALMLQATFYGKTGSAALVNDATLGEDFGNDNWLALCDSCNESYRQWDWDFTTQGIGDFYPDTTQNTSKAIFVAGEGWRAVNHGSGRRMDVAFKHDPTWEIRAVAYDVEDGASATGHNWIRRPTWGSTASQVLSSAGGSNCSGFSYGYDGYASLSGINEIVFFSQGNSAWAGILKKVRIIYNTGVSPSTAIPTTDNTVC